MTAPIPCGGRFDLNDMLSNAATASQERQLIDNPVLRGAMIRSIAQWMQLRDPRWNDAKVSDLVAELQAHEDWSL